MKNYANIYVKLNKYDQKDPNDPRKKLTFRGKYSRTFIFEDDLEILKNQIYNSPKLNLYKNEKLNEFQKKHFTKLIPKVLPQISNTTNTSPVKSLLLRKGTAIKDHMSNPSSSRTVVTSSPKKSNRNSIDCEIYFNLEKLLHRPIPVDKIEKQATTRLFKSLRASNSNSTLKLYVENKTRTTSNFLSSKLNSKGSFNNSKKEADKKNIKYLNDNFGIVKGNPVPTTEHSDQKKSFTILQKINSNKTVANNITPNTHNRCKSVNTRDNVLTPRDFFKNEDFFFNDY